MAHFVVREERFRVIRKEQHEYYMAPREELYPLEMIMFEQIGKRSNHHQQDFADDYYVFQKPYYHQQSQVNHRGPYLHATIVRQQPYVAYKEPHVETRIVTREPQMQGNVTQYHQGDQNYPQANMVSNQVAPQVMKKQGGAIDCNEAAKLYGGLLSIEYGRNNKFQLRA
ncbi:hypothetical protein TorRG33x02_111520 [Trema orientale]|uniref:Uncharacterized protein n=1 Tax=Trema orientale TaxID=63057 RepID=A0A2P5F627_TREOI|nr:hypothetical protein TorRG33x02_111520 [Trema orientale]